MATTYKDSELIQAFAFFANGKKDLGLEDYLNALKHVGIVYNKTELEAITGGDKKTFKQDDFINDYKRKTAEVTKDVLLGCFQVFDPENTGNISVDQIHRALISYGERLTKEEADQYLRIFNLKEGQNTNYHELVDKMLTI